MIKLFWNTHNQKKTKTNDKNLTKEEDLDFIWGVYHKKSSDEWIYEILKKVEYTTIQSEINLEKDDTLIIVDSSVDKKNDLYSKLKLICSKLFLFHLGDEAGSINVPQVYNNCTHVWRTFCSNRYFNNPRVSCIPIGYKSGVLKQKIDSRKYKWAFTGTAHKTSRHDLLFQFSDIKPFFCHKTEKFDKNTISAEEMSKVLSSTEFLPCPNGFVHPETYRLYEALECGCIPIVESAYNYYDRLFPKNPFIKINQWSEAKYIMNGWSKNQIQLKQKECQIWWNECKNDIKDFIKRKIVHEQK
tara:strand:- start:1293 stop:2192 length:900 start_codon:yes stop_codon:yes gene_type:complete